MFRLHPIMPGAAAIIPPISENRGPAVQMPAHSLIKIPLRGGAFMFEKFPDVITVKDLAAMLHIGRNSAYELVRSGKIKSVVVGRQIRVAKISVIDFVQNNIAQAS